MRAFLFIFGLVLCVVILEASSCDKYRRQNSTIQRFFSEEGVPKNVSLYWGSDPSRAASALLAVLLRHHLGYQHIRLKKGPRSLQDLAAQVPHKSNGKYDEAILALSSAWDPNQASNHSEWLPNRGEASGLAGPRLSEFNVSPVPAQRQLFVHLADDFVIPDCVDAVRIWSFYKNATALSRCGFTKTSRANEIQQATVYGLDPINQEAIKDLQARAKASFLHLQFQEFNRKDLLKKLRTNSGSFLFVDYDIWSEYRDQYVQVVQPPPCILVNFTCRQELDNAVPMRAADVYLLQEYAPELFHVANSFKPSAQTLRSILELESDGTDIEEAACEWASKHEDIVNDWVGMYNDSQKVYEIGVFYCVDDPDLKKYDEVLRILGNKLTYDLSLSQTRLRRFKTDCSDKNYVKSVIDHYMSDLVRQRLIGAVVGVKNMTDVASTVDGSKLPVMFYDAVGVDTESMTSSWLSTGNSLHLALALKHFIRSMGWSRVAVISEMALSAKNIVEDLKAVGGFSIRNHLVNREVTKSEAKAVLQKIITENARIVFVNTNFEDAATILSAAVELQMNKTKEYAWIVRDWPANKKSKLIKDIKHFTISFSCRSGSDLNGTDGWENIREAMDHKLKKKWPAHAAGLADAVLTVASGFQHVLKKYPQARGDVHSKRSIWEFRKSLEDIQIKGVTRILKYKGRSLDGATVFIEEWTGGQREHLARWLVNGTARTVLVERERRAAYFLGNSPHDGASTCMLQSGDLYMPTCHDAELATGLLFLILLPPTLLLLYYVVRRRLQETKQKIIYEVLTQRQQRAASLPPTYFVNRSALEIRNKIGAGRFGCVSLAMLRASGRRPQYVAAKAVLDHRDETELLHEACTLASLKHDHIIRLIGVVIDQDSPLVLMEIAFFGDLLQYLRDRRYLAEGATSLFAELDMESEEATHVSAEALTRLARQAASALAYLSERGVVHRDFRASNCLIDVRRSLKVADFGMAREMMSKGAPGDAEYACRRRGLFPVLWMAPESLEQGVFTAASDVWAFGVLVFELVTLGARPYGDMSPLRVMQFVSTGGKPSMPCNATQYTMELVRQCWQRRPEQRPAAMEIVTFLTEHSAALCPALNWDKRPSDADSGFGESLLTELLPPC